MRILLATDGSEYSLAAARKCFGIVALNNKTEVKVICVAENIVPYSQFGVSVEYLDIAQKAAAGFAEFAVERTKRLIQKILEKPDFDPETKTIVGFPKEGILDEAENWQADLIVVGSHGRGFLGRMFLGSVSSAIVKHAKCSVLVVRADESEIKEIQNEAAN